MQKETLRLGVRAAAVPRRASLAGVTTGRPVLLFPTAGGDFEEVERHGLIAALAPLIDAGRIKVYSVDSVAGRHWIEKQPLAASTARGYRTSSTPSSTTSWCPLIRRDCASTDIEIVAPAPRSAPSTPWRRSAATRTPSASAIGMSGTYDLSHYVRRPLERRLLLLLAAALPARSWLRAGSSQTLRRRFVVLASGSGRWENIDESWAMASVLGGKGDPEPCRRLGPGAATTTGRPGAGCCRKYLSELA